VSSCPYNHHFLAGFIATWICTSVYSSLIWVDSSVIGRVYQAGFGTWRTEKPLTKFSLQLYEKYELEFLSQITHLNNNTGRFIMVYVITNMYNKKTKGPTLIELFTATRKLKKCFLTTRDVRCVYHGWHGTHRYDIQVLATHASMQRSVPDLCSSEEYRCTHVDACVERTWMTYRCVPCHPWYTHRTSLVVKKTFSVFLWLWTIPLTFRNPASYIKDGHTATFNTPHFSYFFNKYTYWIF
jgi:hypothetical protein